MTGEIFADFWVDGEPVGQPRPRSFIQGGRVVVWAPNTDKAWKRQITLAVGALQSSPWKVDGPMDGPLALRLRFFFPRPKKHFRTGKHADVIRDDAPCHHTVKPDSDNAAKAVMDQLTELGIWNDDAQVAKLSVTKEYGNTPGCRVTITSALQEERDGQLHKITA